MDKKRTVLGPELKSIFSNYAVFAPNFGVAGMFYHLVKIVAPPKAHCAADLCGVFLVELEL